MLAEADYLGGGHAGHEDHQRKDEHRLLPAGTQKNYSMDLQNKPMVEKEKPRDRKRKSKSTSNIICSYIAWNVLRYYITLASLNFTR